MNNRPTPAAPRTTARFSIWPGAIFVLLGVNVCVVGTTIFMAVSDRTFGVEPGYYEKAVDWDKAVAQRDRNAALGWSIDVTDDAPLTVALTDRDGSPISGAHIDGLVFHHARSAQRLDLTLHEREPVTQPGVYSMDESIMAMPGLWQVRLSITHASAQFTADFVHTVRGNP